MDEMILGGYFQDILDQPHAVRDTVTTLGKLEGLRPFAERMERGEIRSVLLTGMGASYHALLPLELELLGQGLNARRIETSELIHHAPRLLSAQTLVIANSQSGQSVEIIKLLERQRSDHFPLIGVTNTVDSPLAAAAEAVILTRAGSEYSVSSKTYVAALAALGLVGACLTRQDIGAHTSNLLRAADAMELYLSGAHKHIADLVTRFKNVQQLALVGRGPSLAAVGTGALVIREAAHFPCQEMSSAAFRHGPMEMVSPQLFVLVFAGIEPTLQLNRNLAADIRAAGGYAQVVEEISALFDSAKSAESRAFSLPPSAPLTLPLLEILVPQMISIALARLEGRVAGNFERIAKVTATE